jgi:hypothetical protein
LHQQNPDKAEEYMSLHLVETKNDLREAEQAMESALAPQKSTASSRARLHPIFHAFGVRA